jgi:hypothetical protein
MLHRAISTGFRAYDAFAAYGIPGRCAGPEEAAIPRHAVHESAET